MRVLHLHYTDSPANRGGGIVAMSRLHQGLKQANVQSKILAKVTRPEYADSARMPSSGLVRRLEKLIGRVTVPMGLNDVHCISSFGLKRTEAYREADILDFHGMQSGYFSFMALPGLTENKPGVLTLHDMWPITGHCAYSYDCERWKTGCGKCPYLDVSPPVERDSTKLEWKLKRWVYSRSNLAVVTLSDTQTAQVRQSILNRFPIRQIPHGVDTSVYAPFDKEVCRRALNLPAGKKVLLFAAAKLSQYNKGGDVLAKALNSLPASLQRDAILLTLGDRGEGIRDAVNMPVYSLGYASGDRIKAVVYSAADLFVLPTRAETFGLVLLESMACGTPVISTRVGGVPDLVRPGVTGYLTAIGDYEDTARRVEELLADESLRRQMAENCIRIVAQEFTLERQVQAHIDLYRELIGN